MLHFKRDLVRDGQPAFELLLVTFSLSVRQCTKDQTKDSGNQTVEQKNAMGLRYMITMKTSFIMSIVGGNSTGTRVIQVVPKRISDEAQMRRSGY